jgi:hypothetical protein
VAAHHRGVDRAVEGVIAVVLAAGLERLEPVDTAIGGGDIAVDTDGNVVGDVDHERVD